MRRLIALAAIVVSMLLATPSAIAEECLKIASNTSDAKVLKRGITPGIKEVFKQAKICMEHVEMPPKRVRQNMVEGAIDGEYVRVKAYINSMKDHVVAVPTPISGTIGHVMTLNSGDFKPKTLADIGDKRIGIVHGTKWHQHFSKGLKNIKKSNKMISLIKQMKAGRIDGMFLDSGTHNILVSRGFLKEGDFHRSEPIADLSVYLLLHKKNANLVGKLDKAVQAVKKADGFSIK